MVEKARSSSLSAPNEACFFFVYDDKDFENSVPRPSFCPLFFESRGELQGDTEPDSTARRRLAAAEFGFNFFAYQRKLVEETWKS